LQRENLTAFAYNQGIVVTIASVWLDDADRSNDPRIVSRKYSAPEGCALVDESAWSAANPALGVFRSLADLREQAKQAARMPSMENTSAI
jgi:phage terminase large subunit-like protein